MAPRTKCAFAKRSLMKRPASPAAHSLKKPSTVVANIRKKVARFDFGGNHKYKCQNGGKFVSYYIADDGSSFHGSNQQAHNYGLSWTKHGVRSCCDAVRLNSSYTFKLEPENPFDSKAVQIFGDQTQELVGHVPREDNLFIGQLLKKSMPGGFMVVGERVCGSMMTIDCFVEGPASKLGEFEDVSDVDF